MSGQSRWAAGRGPRERARRGARLRPRGSNKRTAHQKAHGALPTGRQAGVQGGQGGERHQAEGVHPGGPAGVPADQEREHHGDLDQGPAQQEQPLAGADVQGAEDSGDAQAHQSGQVGRLQEPQGVHAVRAGAQQGAHRRRLVHRAGVRRRVHPGAPGPLPEVRHAQGAGDAGGAVRLCVLHGHVQGGAAPGRRAAGGEHAGVRRAGGRDRGALAGPR
mmetsp:Transcript_19379/g.42419  ORF Transcript_19379/g.42419 Transcript_19379/m.42419 type:complete len:218 (-) Transcript_19379:552-1205(-)